MTTPTLATRLRSPTPPQMLFEGNPEDIGQGSHFYAHPGSPFRKNRSETHKNVRANIRDANGRLLRAKYAHFIFDSEVPHAQLTMGRGHPVYMLPLRAPPLPPSAHISPFTLFQQRLFK